MASLRHRRHRSTLSIGPFSVVLRPGLFLSQLISQCCRERERESVDRESESSRARVLCNDPVFVTGRFRTAAVAQRLIATAAVSSREHPHPNAPLLRFTSQWHVAIVSRPLSNFPLSRRTHHLDIREKVPCNCYLTTNLNEVTHYARGCDRSERKTNKNVRKEFQYVRVVFVWFPAAIGEFFPSQERLKTAPCSIRLYV